HQEWDMNIDRTSLEVSGGVFGFSFLALYLLYDITRFLVTRDWREFLMRECLGDSYPVPRRAPGGWCWLTSVGSGLVTLVLVLGPARPYVTDNAPGSASLGFRWGLCWLALFVITVAILYQFGIRLVPGHARGDVPRDTSGTPSGEGVAELAV